MLKRLSNQGKSVNYRKLYFKRDAGLKFDFRGYNSLKEIFRDIYYNKFSTKKAENMQNEFNAVLTALKIKDQKNLNK